MKYNPVRPPEFGGARCRSESDYTAVILTSRQLFQILNSMPLLQQTMLVLDAATGLRYSEIAGLQWLDIDWENNQIHVRRRWIRGNVDRPKSRKSAAPVAMAPLLDRRLRAWQMESLTQIRRTGSLLLIRPAGAPRGSVTCCAGTIFVLRRLRRE